MPSKSVRGPKRTYTGSVKKRPDGRGREISVSTYKRQGKRSSSGG